jgi:hypothetical protein
LKHATFLLSHAAGLPVTDSPPLFYNEDSTDFFFHGTWSPGAGGAALDTYVDRIADAGATTVLCNTNAQRTNYASDVWTPVWEGYDPDGPEDQPFLAPLPPASRSTWQRLAANARGLHDEGVCYPERFLRRARQRGLSAWISLRMNDVHDQANLEHPIHGRLWCDRPDLWRQGCEGYYARAFDWEQPEVRDYYMALVDESLERFVPDGLELDFLREPYLFSAGREAAGGEALTDWVGQVHERVQVAARRSGHPVRLGVRTPSRLSVARAFGLDPVGWAHAGWLDLLVVGPRWSTLEFDMPLPDWRARLAGSGVQLAGGLEILLGRHWTAAKRPVTAAEARGAAAQVLAGGADAVYLFNYFPSIDADTVPDAWPRHSYAQTLRSLASLERVERVPRTHAITFTDLAGPEGTPPLPVQLPARGRSLTLWLPTGPTPASDATVVLRLQLASADPEREARLDARLNGGPSLAPASPAGDAPDRRLRTWVVSPDSLRHEQPNRIDLDADLEIEVGAVDISVSPAAA